MAYIRTAPTKKGWDQQAVAHELGHTLNLEHTFHDPRTILTGFDANIPFKTTQNIMDYSDETNMFFYYQWKHSF